jgi:phosphatidate cytidylyltransferase
MRPFHSLARRIAVAVPGLGLFAAVACFNSSVITILFFSLLAALCASEALSLLRPSSGPFTRMAFAVLTGGTTAVVAMVDPALSMVVLLFPGAAFSMAFIFIDGTDQARLKTAGIFGISVVIAIGFGLLARLRLDFPSPWVMFIPLFICWIGDTLAYFVGSAFGKHKLAPSISPAKSLEGFMAGVAGSAGGAVIAGSAGAGYAVPLMVLVGLAGGIAAVAGDLLESSMKRDAGVKDSGSLLPGHGGLLDRFDSILAVVPVVWILLTILPGAHP